MRDEVSKKVKELVVDITGNPYDKVTLDTKLRDLDLDSLEYVEVIVQIEDEFGVEIVDQVASSLATVEDFVNFLEVYLKNNLASSN